MDLHAAAGAFFPVRSEYDNVVMYRGPAVGGALTDQAQRAACAQRRPLTSCEAVYLPQLVASIWSARCRLPFPCAVGQCSCRTRADCRVLGCAAGKAAASCTLATHRTQPPCLITRMRSLRTMTTTISRYARHAGGLLPQLRQRCGAGRVSLASPLRICKWHGAVPAPSCVPNRQRSCIHVVLPGSCSLHVVCSLAAAAAWAANSNDMVGLSFLHAILSGPRVCTLPHQRSVCAWGR